MVAPTTEIPRPKKSSVPRPSRGEAVDTAQDQAPRRVGKLRSMRPTQGSVQVNEPLKQNSDALKAALPQDSSTTQRIAVPRKSGGTVQESKNVVKARAVSEKQQAPVEEKEEPRRVGKLRTTRPAGPTTAQAIAVPRRNNPIEKIAQPQQVQRATSAKQADQVESSLKERYSTPKEKRQAQKETNQAAVVQGRGMEGTKKEEKGLMEERRSEDAKAKSAPKEGQLEKRAATGTALVERLSEATLRGVQIHVHAPVNIHIYQKAKSKL